MRDLILTMRTNFFFHPPYLEEMHLKLLNVAYLQSNLATKNFFYPALG